ncbi:MAG: Uncharacterized protein Greene071421_561 [Parcubacteria group bacterium Greene0714_21]|nr:MAG: Uncharacterized protein Greene041639_514 [Parcubacteria group bacterium Greene0416_39]TSC97390.1 MAG: Uncharacterized protein Greene101447_515 [Parcubacteria group bacterium Greene1014_47]TSD03861.1 MAG: Uncharacterized protein Greene071421_561 [Parcubacteria group bacterium Greene0714_21]
MYEQAVKKNVRKLRGKGFTFIEIIQKFPFLSKGTVSEWVSDIKLTPLQEQRILKKKLRGRIGLLNYNKRRHKEAVRRAVTLSQKAKKEIGVLTSRDLKIAGAALYWGEGWKKNRNTISIGNSDPKFIAVAMRFFREICKVKEEKFRCKLTIHPGLDQAKALKFWTLITGVPLSQFNKVAIKPPKSSTGRMHNVLYKGSLDVRIGDTKTFWRIMGFIEALGNT